MNIVVLVKPVVEAKDISFKDDMTLDRSKAVPSIDMADAHAIALGRAWKKLYGGELFFLTLAPGYPSVLFSQLQAHDATALYQICDACFAGSDCLSTASILSRAITYLQEKLGMVFNVVLAGNRSTDAETGQVPCEVAGMLSVPIISNVLDGSWKEGKFFVSRLLEGIEQQLSVPGPVVLACTPKGFTLEPPSFAGLRKAKDVPYEMLTNKELGLEKQAIGLLGSPTRVRGCTLRVQAWRKPVMIYDPAVGAKIIADALHESRKPLPVEKVVPVSAPPRTGKEVVILLPSFDHVGWQTGEELLSALSLLGKKTVALIITDHRDAQLVQEVAGYGAVSVEFLLAETTPDDLFLGSSLAQYLKGRHCVVLAASSVRMRVIASVCAAQLKAGIAADCTGLSWEGEDLVQIRPAFEGTSEARIITEGKISFATVRPHVFSRRPLVPLHTIPVRCAEGSGKPSVLLCDESTGANEVALEEERVVFSIGAGVDDPSLRRRIASFVPRIGASRKAVTLYGIPYASQVGQTGMLVHCDVYVAFGISGAAQHVVGIGGAKKVIAVNADEKAPIFSFSDVAICSKVEDVIKELENREKE